MIEVKNLTFHYKNSDKPALYNIYLNISKGENVLIMGHSGAGKSTLILTLNCIIPKFTKGKFEGQVIIDGIDTQKSTVAEMSSKVGIVFQDFEIQLFSTNVELEAAFLPENLGIPGDEIRRRVNKYLAFVGLSGFTKRQPAELSGGEKQRLAIASVLTGEPEILCLDEPTTDLDPVGKRMIFDIASSLKKDRNTTLVMVDHETENIADVDRIIVMDHGKIVDEGKPTDILNKIDMLERCGINPPQIAKFFHMMGSKVIPIDIDSAIKLFHENNYKFNDDKFKMLQERDKEKSKQHCDKVIEIKGVNFRYSKKSGNVLSDVNLDIRKREYVAILGANGSGKTTLVKHINGLLAPSEGDVVVQGKNTRKTKICELGKIVGYVFQNPDHQIFSDTVKDEVAFGPKQLGFPKDEIERNVTEALASVDLLHAVDSDPFTLTKGERQRVAVASALATKSGILIFDEPTTGLDYNELRGMLDMMRKLNDAGHTIIIVTHAMWVAVENAHRVIVMQDGRIAKDGPTREVFADVAALERSYLSLPQISRFSLAIADKVVMSVEEMGECTIGGF
jgi:energy-coupling factor transport system ATP-binding protein